MIIYLLVLMKFFKCGGEKNKLEPKLILCNFKAFYSMPTFENSRCIHG